MKILINTSNLYVGGGVQVALSFINELKKINKSHIYYIFLSRVIDKELNKSAFPENFHFFLIENSPAPLMTRKKVVKKLATLEEQIEPDVVFTIFGPSYWRPKARHIVGFADGWVYNPSSVVYKKLPMLKRWKMQLRSHYKSYHLKKDSDYLVVETNDAKIKLATVTRIDKNTIFVVGNTYSTIFDDKQYISKDNKNYIYLPKKEKNEFRFIYIAHNHPNKNIAIINEIIPLLDKNLNIKFVLTIDEISYHSLFPNQPKQIINIGPVSQKSCPSIYEQCDALFAPTLLETFSAVYPEAMKMRKPILTSNYSFAKDICQDAALYFEPLKPKEIAEKIVKFIHNKKLQEELVAKGEERLKTFETARSRAVKYLEILEQIYVPEKYRYFI